MDKSKGMERLTMIRFTLLISCRRLLIMCQSLKINTFNKKSREVVSVDEETESYEKFVVKVRKIITKYIIGVKEKERLKRNQL